MSIFCRRSLRIFAGAALALLSPLFLTSSRTAAQNKGQGRCAGSPAAAWISR
jgi:hypothetical protein